MEVERSLVVGSVHEPTRTISAEIGKVGAGGRRARRPVGSPRSPCRCSLLLVLARLLLPARPVRPVLSRPR